MPRKKRYESLFSVISVLTLQGTQAGFPSTWLSLIIVSLHTELSFHFLFLHFLLIFGVKAPVYLLPRCSQTWWSTYFWWLCASKTGSLSHFWEACLCCVTCQCCSSNSAQTAPFLTWSHCAVVVLLGQFGLHLLHMTRAGLSSGGQCIFTPLCDSNNNHEEHI